MFLCPTSYKKSKNFPTESKNLPSGNLFIFLPPPQEINRNFCRYKKKFPKESEEIAVREKFDKKCALFFYTVTSPKYKRSLYKYLQ